MARLSYIVTVIGIALMCVLAEEIQYYSDKYDDTDALSIMQNDKLREEYFMCFMEIGPCKTADAKFFKNIFNEVVQTKCRRCTEKQKNILNIVVDWYTANDPEKWERLVRKSVEDTKKAAAAGQ